MTGRTMKPITVEARLPAPPDEVFAFIADTRNDPQWCSNVETVEVIAGGAITPGTAFRFHQHFDRPGGRRMQFDVDVTIESTEGRSITWVADDRFQLRRITIAVEPAGEDSKVTQTTVATFKSPPGPARWMYPLLAKRTFKRQFAALAARYR
ncbi:MAG TPA: SRPBCC family protein [Acidimicrobiia bacterium]|jgi:uncharacterized protein YndB with AHSA1/START domain